MLPFTRITSLFFVFNIKLCIRYIFIFKHRGLCAHAHVNPFGVNLFVNFTAVSMQKKNGVKIYKTITAAKP